MAMTQEQAMDQKKGGILDVNSSEFYWDKLRPLMESYNKTYSSDPELNKTFERMMNMADSAMQNKDFNLVTESVGVFNKVVSDKTYMSRHMKTATDEEKQAITDILKKVSDLMLIMQSEGNPPQKKDKSIKERVAYIPSEDNYFGGENEDFKRRNMSTLNQGEPVNKILNGEKKSPGVMTGSNVTML